MPVTAPTHATPLVSPIITALPQLANVTASARYHALSPLNFVDYPMLALRTVNSGTSGGWKPLLSVGPAAKSGQMRGYAPAAGATSSHLPSMPRG